MEDSNLETLSSSLAFSLPLLASSRSNSAREQPRLKILITFEKASPVSQPRCQGFLGLAHELNNAKNSRSFTNKFTDSPPRRAEHRAVLFPLVSRATWVEYRKTRRVSYALGSHDDAGREAPSSPLARVGAIPVLIEKIFTPMCGLKANSNAYVSMTNCLMLLRVEVPLPAVIASRADNWTSPAWSSCTTLVVATY
eukprot:1194179-Prorocentrum_minimum.AAC.4